MTIAGGAAAPLTRYKDIALVPDEAFERVGLAPPPRHLPVPPRAGRTFSDDELADLARPVVERIIEAVEHHDAEAALGLIDRSWRAWTNLHDAYRCWFAMFSAELTDEAGAARGAADRRERLGLSPAVLEDADSTDDAWVWFWRNHVGSVGFEETPTARVLAVPRDALIHPGLGDEGGDVLATQLADSVTEGAARHGHGRMFGQLRYGSGDSSTSCPSAARARSAAAEGALRRRGARSRAGRPVQPHARAELVQNGEPLGERAGADVAVDAFDSRRRFRSSGR